MTESKDYEPIRKSFIASEMAENKFGFKAVDLKLSDEEPADLATMPMDDDIPMSFMEFSKILDNLNRRQAKRKKKAKKLSKV